jgi:transposase
MYETGGLRRTHLRGHQNILKRLLVHAGAFNLGILMRKMFGHGTPRGLQGRRSGPRSLEIACRIFLARVWRAIPCSWCVTGSTPKALRAYSTVVLAW